MSRELDLKNTLLYEGKAKKVHATSQPEELIVVYKDSLTAFNAQKKGSFPDKGSINCKITVLLFKELEKKSVKTHLLRPLADGQLLVRKLRIIPFEVVVRNRVAGSLAARLGIEEGRVLRQPVVEFYYKDDNLGDPFISREQILALGMEDSRALDEMSRQALVINDLLTKIFQKIGLLLVDFKIEFGRDAQGEIVLGDEITPDCCRLWDLATNEKMDKDRFRRDLGGIQEAYQEVLGRLERSLHSA